MKKALLFHLVVLMLIGLFCFELSGEETVIRLRLYEGMRENAPSSSEVISAYHLNPAPRNLEKSSVSVASEQNSLKRIFNLKEVKLIAFGNLAIDLEKKGNGSRFFVHNKKSFILQLTMISGKNDRFQLRVMENRDKTSPLLETKIVIPHHKTAVIGFRDSEKQIYFISFSRIRGRGFKNKTETPYEQPELIKKVNPHYPEKAKEMGLQGMEILEAKIDKDGNIIGLESILTSHPLLNHSAMTAIKQWKYTPGMISGKSTPVPLTVMVNYVLEKGSLQPASVDFSIDSVRLRFLNRVAPKYPAAALEKNIQGKVIMMAFVDKKGCVSHTKVFKGDPILAQAAETAMKQWRFQPYRIAGKRQSILFTVAFNFTMNKKPKK